jgi:hypothetical protein
MMSHPISPNPDRYPCCGALTFGEHRDNVDARKCSRKAWNAFLAAIDDKSPHCSCGSGDGSDAHAESCELVAEGDL